MDRYSFHQWLATIENPWKPMWCNGWWTKNHWNQWVVEFLKNHCDHSIIWPMISYHGTKLKNHRTWWYNVHGQTSPQAKRHKKYSFFHYFKVPQIRVQNCGPDLKNIRVFKLPEKRVGIFSKIYISEVHKYLPLVRPVTTNFRIYISWIGDKLPGTNEPFLFRCSQLISRHKDLYIGENFIKKSVKNLAESK